MMMPLSAWMSNDPPPPSDITGSIPKPTVAAPSPDSDSDVIRNTVATALPEIPVISWKNPSSGNSGTITKVAPIKAVNGAPCRTFESTLVTIEGVRLYRGQACQGYAGPWDLVRFEPADAANPG